MFDVPRRSAREKVDEVLSIVGLQEVSDERVHNYSSGMKQRLGIARGLLVDADILLMDEPTRSLDPLHATQLDTFIKEDLIGRKGKTIIIATHNMEQASFLCDQVAIMHAGSIKVTGTVADIVSRVLTGKKYIVTVIGEPNSGVAELAGLSPDRDAAQYVHACGNSISVEVEIDDPLTEIPRLLERLKGGGADTVEVRQKPASLIDAVEALATVG